MSQYARRRRAKAAALATALLAACAATAAVAGPRHRPVHGDAPPSSTTTQPTPPRLTQGTWWQPRASTTWQWQLTGNINTSYDVAAYDIDLFETPQATINNLHAAGRKVICYFSAGSAENWRPDYGLFQPADIGKPLDGWPGERWVDTRSANVRNIMRSRLDLARSKGCDAVEPDNVEAYNADSGFPLSGSTQLDYNRFLANEAHARGIAIGLKNDVDQLSALEPSFDFAVNEQCHQYNECGGYAQFTQHDKAVLNAEYSRRYVRNTGGARDALCASSRAANIRTLVLPVALDGSFRYSCD